MTTNTARQLTAETGKHISEIEKIEQAIKACESELAESEKRHQEVIEQWQTESALSSTETQEPRELRKLAERILQLRARRTGLRKRLIDLCGRLGPLEERLEAAIVEGNQNAGRLFRSKLDAAIGELLKLAAEGLRLAEILGHAVIPKDLPIEGLRGRFIYREDGVRAWQEIKPAESLPQTYDEWLALRQTALTVKQKISRGRAFHSKLKDEEKKRRDGGDSDLMAYAAGLNAGRTQSQTK